MTRLEYLGFIIDTISMTVSLPTDKTEGLLKCVGDLLRKQRPTIMVAQVVGSLIAARHATKHAILFTKSLEIGKIQALKESRGNFEEK